MLTRVIIYANVYISKQVNTQNTFKTEVSIMFNATEVLVNIVNPINKVTFEKVNPNNAKLFCGTDELGLYSENWELDRYVTKKEWDNV